MIFVDASTNLSLDNLFAKRKQFNPVPYWNFFVLRWQIVLVYLFGGIAKINSDWLAGEPLRNWLASRDHLPYIGEWLTSPEAPYFFSYGGLFFDLAIGFILLQPRLRWFGVCGVLFFNCMNAYIFSIGIFPWFMLAATVLFFGGSPMEPEGEGVLSSGRFARTLTTIGIVSYLLFQTLYPLRHHLIPGNVTWTEEGHRFSWRMKLRDKEATLLYVIRNPERNEHSIFDPRTLLPSRQIRKMRNRPDMIYEYAQHLKQKGKENGVMNPDIRAISFVSLNGRSYQKMIDPTVNLAEAKYSPFTQSKWILPLEEGLEIGKYPRPPSYEKIRSVIISLFGKDEVKKRERKRGW